MRLQDLLQQPNSLPVAPDVAARLIATLGEDDVDLNAVTATLEQDPAMAARVLQQANSAFFRLLRPVLTVRDAVAVMGLNKVRSLVIATAMQQRFPVVDGVDLDQFWRYSFASATLARIICSPRRLDENVAFTAALLHAVGELVMHTGMPETMRDIRQQAPLFALNRASAEYTALGYSYAEVGAALAHHWKLPKLLVGAIELHVDPLHREPLEPLAAVVHMAAWRARVWLAGNQRDDLIHTYPDAEGEVLELDPDLLVEPEVAGLDEMAAHG